MILNLLVTGHSKKQTHHIHVYPGIHSRQGRCQASTQNIKQKEKQPFV